MELFLVPLQIKGIVMDYTDEQLESIYKELGKRSPDMIKNLEIAIRNSMPFDYITTAILKYPGMPPHIKKGVVLAIEWKYRQIEKSIINN
jgi:hypothetical protein